MSPRRLVVAAVLAAAWAAPAPAQGGKPLNAVPPLDLSPHENIDERLFLVYAAEDLYRTIRVPPLGANPGPELRAALSQRRLAADQLALRAERQQYGPGYAALFEQFKKDLGPFDALADALDAARARQAGGAARRFGPVRLDAGAAGVAMTALAAADDRRGPAGRAVASALARAVGRELAAAKKPAPPAADLSAFEAEAAADFDQALASFRDAWARAQAEAGPRLRSAAATLAKSAKWSFGEVDAPPTDPAAAASLRPRDPFRIEAVVRGRNFPPDRAGASARAEAARELTEAARLIPRGKEYDEFRARFLGRAGVLANEACALQLGAAGFAAGPPPAAKLAVQAWQAYVKHEPADRDPGGRVAHQFMLANAYAKRFRTAYAAARLASGSRGGEPAFWYDAARVCGQAGDLHSALFCLAEAVQRGYPRKDDAQVTPDLAAVRKNDPRGFEDALAGRKPPPPPKPKPPAAPPAKK